MPGKNKRRTRQPASLDSLLSLASTAEESAERWSVSDRPKSVRQYKAALVHYTQCTALSPATHDILYNAARIHHILSQHNLVSSESQIQHNTSSIKLFKEARLIATEDAPETSFNLAQSLHTHYTLTDSPENLAEAYTILSSLPSDDDTLLALAQVEKDQGNNEASLTTLAKISTKSAASILATAQNITATGDPDRALELINECLALDPSYVEALTDAADILLDSDRWSDAKELYERSYKIQKCGEIAERIAEACLMMGDMEGAGFWGNAENDDRCTPSSSK